MKMTKHEEEMFFKMKTLCSDYECTLFRDEIVSMTLYSVAHIKDLKLRIEGITAVHSSMNIWASQGEKHSNIVNCLYKDDAIIAHGVTVVRQEQVTYDPKQATEKETKLKAGERLVRGIGGKNVFKNAQEITF